MVGIQTIQLKIDNFLNRRFTKKDTDKVINHMQIYTLI